jgi:hypothetical protein
MRINIIVFIFIVLPLLKCSFSPVAEIKVHNPADIQRSGEVIEINFADIGNLLRIYSPKQLFVIDGQTNETLLSQMIDLNGDGTFDRLIFQCDLYPSQSKHFYLKGAAEDIIMSETNVSAYARFVPERIDDFAWENDRVAFRTYGPKAQEITESGKPGGTLTSGIDCWLKRVDYPIIDKWYKEDLEEGKSYHKDQGEGLDNYHVGASRGTGGVGIWQDSILLTSGNFKSWKIIANGPIRTIFELDYGTWEAGDVHVEEVKHITIDLGSNLFKNTLLLKNYDDLPNITLGVTLHDEKGEVEMNPKKGWFRYWEPLDDSELSTAIVIDPRYVRKAVDFRPGPEDQSNLLVVCESAPELIYYAGFAWGKSNQFELPDGFDDYLSNFADRIASPVQVEVIIE